MLIVADIYQHPAEGDRRSRRQNHQEGAALWMEEKDTDVSISMTNAYNHYIFIEELDLIRTTYRDRR